MKKPVIFIINHGEFGKALIESAELIAGPLDDIYAFSLKKGMSLEDLIELVEDNLKTEKNVIILTDLFGGTPNNVAVYLQNKYQFPLISGVNLPILLNLVLSRDAAEVDIDSIISDTVVAGKDSIQYQELKNEFEIGGDDFD
ncbi:MAG: PTS sugar transporter subunit IIA [Fusobacteriales bacterium]|jgi:mannose/fructose/sorbose-specific phosphotransferase system IIA component|nr:PTS sugar transporter subunit IIA [Fusobacteriales bacterium]